MKFVIARVTSIAILVACAASQRQLTPGSGTINPLATLVVEYGGPKQLELKVGEILTLHPSLRNVGSQQVSITHGSRLFVLDALFSPVHGEAAPSADFQFPRADTWGEVRHLEYPNPNAIYTAPLYLKTLEPGELYAPALLNLRSEYDVPLDSAGKYAIRVCAHVTEDTVCGRWDILVTVR